MGEKTTDISIGVSSVIHPSAIVAAVLQVQSVEQIMRILMHPPTGHIFRGVSNRAHELLPKVGRPGARKDQQQKSLPYSRDEDDKLLRQFGREARPFLKIAPASDLELMAIGQHFNLPTRLLDWSESPLFALYFAVCKSGVYESVKCSKPKEECGAEKNPDAAVYGIPIPPEIKGASAEQSAYALTEGDPLLYRPTHLDQRIVAQRGVFTLHPNPAKAYTPPAMTQWIIPADLCFPIRTLLDNWGINSATLFPDLGGLCDRLAWAYKRQRLV